MAHRVFGSKFEEALLFALQIHGCDLRKGTSIPYISHLLGVCALVMESGGDEDEAIAALLHDSLEDHPEEVTRSDLDHLFGTHVADIVARCTDTLPDYKGGPKSPWRERKAAYVERLGSELYPRCRVSLADKLHNLRTIVMDYRQIGDAIWARFNASKVDQLRYFRALVEAFRNAQAPEHLLAELDSLVKELGTDSEWESS